MNSPSTNTIGKYQIIREIARSNDIVYEAIDPSINRRIALKELCIPANLQGAQRRERIERFWREGKAAGRLSHPNIVTIFEVGKDNDRHFIAMEYLEGQTLRDMIQAGGPLSLKDATDFILQLCSALAYAHKNGVVHRDIKPENVQVLPGRYVKLTDFGIARLMGEPSITQNGQVFGTPSYMSPEQVAGKEIDARSDIFSLGVLLYEMIAGKKPFVGDSVVTITYNIMNMEPPPLPGAPAYISSVIRKAMAKDPNMRYSSVEEMETDLREEKANGGFVMPDPISSSSYPSPFGGATQFPPQPQQPQGPLTPYGTPMPSPNAGSSPDPFAPGAPSSAPMPPPPPVRPIMSSETRNFIGVFLLAIGFAGMLIFAIWAINLAYTSYQTATTSEVASKYYGQGQKLHSRGNIEGAVKEWQHAIRVSPDSTIAKDAKVRIFEVSVNLARKYSDERNIIGLKNQAENLIEADTKKPEGHFYKGLAAHYVGDMNTAKKEYELAANYGGSDAYGGTARQYLGHIYLNEGDQFAAIGQKDSAISSYEKAREFGDTESMRVAQEKIDALR